MATQPTTSLEFIPLHPFVLQTIVDKVRGTIFGAALGDCIGLYTEFLPKSLTSKLYPDGITLQHPATPFHSDNHRDKFSIGAWTDDTDHALALLLSFLHLGQIQPHDIAARIKSWASQGLRCLDRLPLGLGATVGKVILRPEFDAEPEQSAKTVWLNSGKNIAPNGSLMRTHPLGITCIAMTEEQCFETTMQVSLVTHYDPRCVVSCCVSTALIRGMLRGEVQTAADIDRIVAAAWEWVSARASETWEDTVLDQEEYTKHTSAESLASLELDDARKMGYVYKALGCGILLLRTAMRTPDTAPDVFGALMMELIREGGDADTNGCIAGALVGCWVGWSALTPRWRDGMQHREWLLRKTDGLCQTVGITGGDYRGSEDADTAIDGGKGLLSRKQLEEREHALVAMVMMKMQDRKEKASAQEKKAKSVWGRLKG